ncbi:RHS repeat-associated core domain-containing protein [Burkholderia stagnalis]
MRLHYNQYRYYDSRPSQFIDRNPIRLSGRVDVYQYASNPTEWIDPLGSSK